MGDNNEKLGRTNWGDVPSDMLLSIFECLSFVDVGRARLVCSYWNSVATECRPKIAWLLLPPQQQLQRKGKGIHDDKSEAQQSLRKSRWFNVEEGRVYDMNNTPTELAESLCVGSCHGYLILIDEKFIPFLLNPLTGYRVDLPPIDICFGIQEVRKLQSYDDVYYMVSLINKKCGYFGSFDVFQTVILKAILSSNPNHSINYKVVVIAGGLSAPEHRGKLFFYTNDENSWIRLEGPSDFEVYSDILCYQNQLYALSRDFCIQVWDLSGSSPMKMMDMQISGWRTRRHRLASRSYLVESCGKILLIGRYFNSFADEDQTPLRTLRFCISEIDFERKELTNVESLGHCALFVGRRQSISVSAQDSIMCERNSIYFIDDDNTKEIIMRNFKHVGNNYINDMGIFLLEEKRIKSFYKCVCSSKENQTTKLKKNQKKRIASFYVSYHLKGYRRPDWIVPNPW